MPQPAKVTDDARAEIEAVAAERWKIPSDKEIAAKYRISVSRVQQLMANVRERLKLHKHVGSTGNLCVSPVSDEPNT